jgi:hypothetical protein
MEEIEAKAIEEIKIGIGLSLLHAISSGDLKDLKNNCIRRLKTQCLIPLISSYLHISLSYTPQSNGHSPENVLAF